MNFFDHQRAAKGTTLKLVFLFAAAVVALVAGVDAAAALAMGYKGADPSSILAVVIVVSAVTLLIIAGGMLFKTLSLRQGGAAVAAAVGAVPVDPTTTDPQLRRLVNIVEEMALASGVPAPRLFVMPREPGINAFAAGFTPADAAIAVTGGALAQLNRDELQGVIGHEFSHILNGDMRLNIRLIGLLTGILLIGMIGLRVLQFGGRGSDSKARRTDRGRRVRDDGARLHRRVLREPDQGGGVATARVAGRRLRRAVHPADRRARGRAEEDRRHTDRLAAARLPQRGRGQPHAVRRGRTTVVRLAVRDASAADRPDQGAQPELRPARDGRAATAVRAPGARRVGRGHRRRLRPRRIGPGSSRPAPQPPAPAPGRHAITAEQVVARAGTFTPADLNYGAALHARLPDDVRQLATQPTTAPVAVIALLLAPPGEALQARQLAAVAQRLGPAPAREAAALAYRMAKLPHELRLPFVALALPQLAAHPRDYQDALVAVLNDLAVADDTVTMFEYCVTRLVWNYLLDAADPSRRSKVGNGSLHDVRPVVTTLLATLAVASGGDQNASARAFHGAMQRLYGRDATAENPRQSELAADARRRLGRNWTPWSRRPSRLSSRRWSTQCSTTAPRQRRRPNCCARLAV